ncbi:hypothetical protein G2W53_027158 [Senna tora]|uniref:Uncharacterized protein n=1 Tax=Senna tora TaxID=362788 RepID=A0A834WI53_9FABA|nr:hypothetical protein G2W53_027158 [Senna tora]
MVSKPRCLKASYICLTVGTAANTPHRQPYLGVSSPTATAHSRKISPNFLTSLLWVTSRTFLSSGGIWRLPHLLSKLNTSMGSNSTYVYSSLASKAQFPTWIIDSGANRHMTAPPKGVELAVAGCAMACMYWILFESQVKHALELVRMPIKRLFSGTDEPPTL